MLKHSLQKAGFAAACLPISDPVQARAQIDTQPGTPATAAFAPSLLDDFRAPFDGPISTDRPDFTESTSVVPRGRFQLEGGYTYTVDRERGRGTHDHTFPEFLLRTGVGSGWELRFAWSGLSLTREAYRDRNDAGRRVWVREHDDGATDLNVGFKTRLVEASGWVPGLSLIGQLSLPTGSLSKSAGDADPEIKLLWSYSLTERLGLAGNVNVAAPNDDRGRFFQNAASISLAYAISDQVGAYVEYFGFYPAARGSDCAHSLNGGFTLQVTENLQFDVRAGGGLNEEADDFFAGVGFAIRF